VIRDTRQTTETEGPRGERVSITFKLQALDTFVWTRREKPACKIGVRILSTIGLAIASGCSDHHNPVE
jgi:hypothetical protein